MSLRELGRAFLSRVPLLWSSPPVTVKKKRPCAGVQRRAVLGHLQGELAFHGVLSS